MKSQAPALAALAVCFALAPSVRSGPPAVKADAAPAVTIPRSQRMALVSSINQRPYQIFIAEPAAKPPASGFPVIYALDGNAAFATLTEAVRIGELMLGPCVVVGIGYPGDGPFDIPRRYYDFTPPTPPEELTAEKLPGGKPPKETGGQDAFLDFIEKDVKPLVDRLLPIDHKRQAIFGHSLGGLFVLHSLFTRPDVFQTYIAASPSIWWNNRAILAEEEIFLARRGAAKEKTGLRLLITTGSLEQMPAPGAPSQRGELLKRNRMVDNAREMAARLAAAAARTGLGASIHVFEGENHGSVIPAALGRAAAFALQQRADAGPPAR